MGICGPTLYRVPGEVPPKKLSDMLNKSIIPEKEAPLNETEQDQGCVYQLATSSPSSATPGTPRTPARRPPGTPRTPRAAIHTPKSTPVRVPVRAPVFDDPACLPLAPKKSLCDVPMQEDAIDLRSPAKLLHPEQVPQEALHDQPEQVPEQCQDLLEQPALVLEDLEQPEPQVAFVQGSVHNVDFVGLPGNVNWDEKVLKNYFFMAEGKKPVCLRAAVSIPMHNILSYIHNKMGLNMAYPILSFKGQVVDLEDALSSFPQCATFLIHDRNIPEAYSSHLGKLWQCHICGLSYAAKMSFKKPCKKGHPHRYLFFISPKHPASIPSSWGHIRGDTRWSNKPWACPVNHAGPLPQETLQGHDVQVHQAQDEGGQGGGLDEVLGQFAESVG